jgi:hypothetical protein
MTRSRQAADKDDFAYLGLRRSIAMCRPSGTRFINLVRTKAVPVPAGLAASAKVRKSEHAHDVFAMVCT